MIEVVCEFQLEIAHSLPMMPDGHKCRRLHGHSYLVRVGVSGPMDPTLGLIVDYALIDEAWMRDVHSKLDHQNLNDVLGTPKTTSEIVVRWIGEALSHTIAPHVRLTFVELWETRRFGARWTP